MIYWLSSNHRIIRRLQLGHGGLFNNVDVGASVCSRANLIFN
jgi:hypothetical protein